jgi:hypothetical protein
VIGKGVEQNGEAVGEAQAGLEKIRREQRKPLLRTLYRSQASPVAVVLNAAASRKALIKGVFD